MKKIIIAFLLISVLAGGAFAELSFSGSAYIGAQFRNPAGADEAITTHHRDYASPQFNLTATVVGGNYGGRLVTRYWGSDFIIRGIYGWVDFLDDSLRLSMGQFSDALWVIRLDSDLPELFVDLITGFRFTYHTPLPGLSVGAAFRSTGQQLEPFFEQMIFGGTYVNPLFSAVFAYDLGLNVRTVFGINFPSFGFAGIPDLSAGFKLFASNLATWDTRAPGLGGTLTMYQRLGYRISWPFSVSLIMSQGFLGHPDMNYTELMFGPGFTFRDRRAPNLSASFRAMIDSPDHFSTSNLTIRPAIEKTLTGPALFYVQYSLELPDFGSSNPMDRAIHTFGIGLEIRAF